MKISNWYVLIEPLPKPATEGFEVVEVQDNSTYKGKIVMLPEIPVYMGNTPVQIGDTVIFAKYSPDTHEVEGKKYVKTTDLLAVI